MYQELTNQGKKIITGKESVVIKLYLEGIEGGRTLDVTDFVPEAIQAGHVIIQNDTTKVFKPMPVNSGATAYAALPAGHSYVGILVANILKSKPFAAIMVRGTINPEATPFPMTTISSTVKTALPLILHRAD